MPSALNTLSFSQPAGESLTYTVNWPTGLSLGEAHLRTSKRNTPEGAVVCWRIQQVIDRVKARAREQELPDDMVEMVGAQWRNMGVRPDHFQGRTAFSA